MISNGKSYCGHDTFTDFYWLFFTQHSVQHRTVFSLIPVHCQCTGMRELRSSVFFVDDNENDDENDEIVSNFRRRD